MNRLEQDAVAILQHLLLFQGIFGQIVGHGHDFDHFRRHRPPNLPQQFNALVFSQRKVKQQHVRMIFQTFSHRVAGIERIKNFNAIRF